jgi:3-hydroxybutyryl-CoA dehydrogenase
VVEAIPEDLELKRQAFRLLDAAASPSTLLATNTSSLSVARIASAAATPERVLGMHFFNPVPLMALVEVIPGPMTDGAAVERGQAIARQLGKEPVVAADTPGFIVNRVARPFYLEAMRIVGEGAARVDEVDGAMRRIGFRMGPFELVDAIGLDVNFAVSNSVYEQAFFEPRYRPHPMQRALVDAGRLGRKSGGGFYEYTPEGARTAVWSGIEQRPDGPRVDHLGEELIAARILATIVNEAASAVADGVATPDAVDTAMRLGTNYPSGPLEWGERIGLDHVLHTLDALNAAVPDGRYRAVPLLRQLAERSGSFFGDA